MKPNDDAIRHPNSSRNGKKNWTNRLGGGARSPVFHAKGCACVVAYTMSCTCGAMDAFAAECALDREEAEGIEGMNAERLDGVDRASY